jgi:hypothetical protein
MFPSELDNIRASVEQNSKTNKTLVRRILDAERVAQDLSNMMSKIQEAYGRFTVRIELPVKKLLTMLQTDKDGN